MTSHRVRRHRSLLFTVAYEMLGSAADAERPRRAVDVLRFYDLPVEHHKHLRTSNVIKSTFATVRLRQKTNKGPGWRDAGVAMAHQLLDAAQARWRRIDGPELVALVRAGATFIDGRLQERSTTDAHAA